MRGSYEIIRGNIVVGAFVHVERQREPAPVGRKSAAIIPFTAWVNSRRDNRLDPRGDRPPRPTSGSGKFGRSR